jgi:Uma2 family endonuclease
VKEHGLGAVYASEAGFWISHKPDTVRASDAAFVRAERAIDTAGFFEGPPDIAFEVISPGDTYSEIEEKTLDWLHAGVRAVIVVDPRTESVRIHRASGATTVTDALEIDDILPGWRLSPSEVFAR